jgi:hypothetical protein
MAVVRPPPANRPKQWRYEAMRATRWILQMVSARLQRVACVSIGACALMTVSTALVLPVDDKAVPRRLEDHECKVKPAGSPITSMGCNRVGSECTGFCLKGETLEEYKDCFPSRGSVCTYEGYTEVKVKWTHSATCVPSGQICKCGSFSKMDFHIVGTIPVRKCQ